MRVRLRHMEIPTTDTGLRMLLNSTLGLVHLTISKLFQMNSIVAECECIHRLIFALLNFSRYLMIDVVVNDVMATSITPDLSTYMFKEQVKLLFCVLHTSITESFTPSRNTIHTVL